MDSKAVNPTVPQHSEGTVVYSNVLSTECVKNKKTGDCKWETKKTENRNANIPLASGYAMHMYWSNDQLHCTFQMYIGCILMKKQRKEVYGDPSSTIAQDVIWPKSTAVWYPERSAERAACQYLDFSCTKMSRQKKLCSWGRHFHTWINFSHCLGHPCPLSEGLVRVLVTQCFQSRLLLMCLGGIGWWLKDLGSLYPHGIPQWCSWPRLQPDLALML